LRPPVAGVLLDQRRAHESNTALGGAVIFLTGELGARRIVCAHLSRLERCRLARRIMERSAARCDPHRTERSTQL